MKRLFSWRNTLETKAKHGIPEWVSGASYRARFVVRETVRAQKKYGL
jgi:hypothetical protein